MPRTKPMSIMLPPGSIRRSRYKQQLRRQAPPAGERHPAHYPESPHHQPRLVTTSLGVVGRGVTPSSEGDATQSRPWGGPPPRGPPAAGGTTPTSPPAATDTVAVLGTADQTI